MENIPVNKKNMQDELQILEEKFKDIKARLGAAISILEEAESLLSGVKQKVSDTIKEKSSLTEFVKNELADGQQDISNNSIVDAADGQLIHQISRAAAFDVANSGTEPIYKYLQGLGGADSINNIWVKFFNSYDWDFGLMESLIRSDSRFSIRHECGEDIVILNEARVATTVSEQKQTKQLTSEDILKYLQGKPQGATLKQIQSRFKGYSGNKCKEIVILVADNAEIYSNFDGRPISQSLVFLKEDRNTVSSRVKNVLSDILNVSDYAIDNADRVVKDLGADSLDIAEIIMSLEDEFRESRIFISDDDAEKIVTVGDIVKYIEGRLGG